MGKPITVEIDESERFPRAAVRDLTLLLHEELQRLFDAAQVRAG